MRDKIIARLVSTGMTREAAEVWLNTFIAEYEEQKVQSNPFVKVLDKMF